MELGTKHGKEGDGEAGNGDKSARPRNLPTPEAMNEIIEKMPLVIGADGVMIPMRPHPGKPDGKTRWREVKVAILSRLGQSVTRAGREFLRLQQRRLVAVLGDS